MLSLLIAAVSLAVSTRAVDRAERAEAALGATGRPTPVDTSTAAPAPAESTEAPVTVDPGGAPSTPVEEPPSDPQAAYVEACRNEKLKLQTRCGGYPVNVDVDKPQVAVGRTWHVPR